MRWTDLEQAQPRLAELGRQRLIEPGVVLVATSRGDGSPRIGAIEPLVLDGRLWLGMMWQSTKARDLLRDPRILVHTVAERLGWRPAPERMHLFDVDIGGVTFIVYDKATGDQHVAMWPPPREFIRRSTTPTSVGAPEPVAEFIVTE